MAPARNPTRYLFVEGPVDESVVRQILSAAKYPLDDLLFVQARGKQPMANLIRRVPPEQRDKCAALIDLDERSVADAIARAREQLGLPEIRVFCAVPEVEAWLFADDLAAAAHALKDHHVQAVLARLPPPEEIPQPRKLAKQVFGDNRLRWSFMTKIDVQRAAARSPSLRIFLSGIAEFLGVESSLPDESVGRTLSRDVLAGLVSEVMPADAVIWRTAAGDSFTAAEVRRMIEAGDELGRQYASDLLRVSRDFLRRAANRKGGT